MRVILLIAVLLIPVSLSPNYFTDKDLETIQSNMDAYQYAENLTDVPVLLLAAIHYRESGLHKGYYSRKRKKVIKNIGGPFMLDYGPLNDHKEFARRIRAHEAKVHKLYKLDGPVAKISHNFKFASLVAAHHIKLKTRKRFKGKERLADAVWGYNGRASWHVLEKGDKPSHINSSYVWSDPLRNHKMPAQYRDKHKRLVKYMDSRAGVMVLYKELNEVFNASYSLRSTNILP